MEQREGQTRHHLAIPTCSSDVLPAPFAPVSRQREPRGSSRLRSWMTGGLKGKEKLRQRTTTESGVSPAATDAMAASGGEAVMAPRLLRRAL